jgi:hypothetical protein
LNIARPAWSPQLVACALALGVPCALAAVPAGAATTAEVDSWLASTTKVVRTAPPGGMRLTPRAEHVSVAGANVEGWIDPDEARRGRLANGQEVMIVPVESGGSGAAFDALLFTRLAGRVRFVGLIPSPNGHLDVALSHGAIVVRTPVYKAGDANCCPSGFHWERDTLRGMTLVKLKEYDTRR